MKKRLFPLVIFLVSLAFLGTGIPLILTGGESLAEPPSSLLVLGDSISAGAGLVDFPLPSYGNRLADQFGILYDSTYQNLAVNGATSEDLLELVTADSAVRTAAQNSEIIVFSIGGNDIMTRLFHHLAAPLGANAWVDSIRIALAARDPSEVEALYESYLADETVMAEFDGLIDAYRANVSEIIGILNGLHPEARIYVLNLYDPMSGIEDYAAADGFAQTVIDCLNEATEDLEGDYVPVDVASAFDQKGETLTNISAYDVHPNAEGHGVILECILEAMETPSPLRVAGIACAACGAALLPVGGILVASKRKRRKSSDSENKGKKG